MADTIKDFLVSFGFKLDEQSQRRTEAGLQKTEEKATAIAGAESAKRVKLKQDERDKWEKAQRESAKKDGERQDKSLKSLQTFAVKASALSTKAFLAIEGSALAVVAAVDKVAQSYSRLNFTAQRAGGTPASFQAFGYAASQLGVDPATASAQLQEFGKRLKNYSGYREALKKQIGDITDKQGNLLPLDQLATRLGARMAEIRAKQGNAVAHAQASAFGFTDYATGEGMMDPKWAGYETEFHSDQAKIGLDPNKAAKEATAFEQKKGHIEQQLGNIGDKVTSQFFKELQPDLDKLSNWIDQHGQKVVDIIGRIAADLVALGKAIIENLARLDWDKILGAIESMANKFDEVSKKLTGQNGLTVAFEAFGAVLATKVLGRLLAVAGTLRTITGMALPSWLLGMLGTTGGLAAATAAGGALAYKEATAPYGNSSAQKGTGMVGLRKHQEDRNEDAEGPWGTVKRAWRGRPKWLGGNGRGLGGDPITAPVSNDADAHNLTRLTEDAAREAGIDPRIMHGIRSGESAHRRNDDPRGAYDVGDGGSSFGPWQLHYGGINPAMPHPGLGDQFTKDTGLDARDPKTIPAQTRWVAKWLKTHSPVGTWFGYHGNRDADPRWGDSGYAYVPPPKKSPSVAPPPAPLAAAPPLPGAGVPIGLRSGGYLALGLGADGKPVHLTHTPTSIMNSTKGDTNVNHTQTFNLHGVGGNGPAMLDAARRTASRGQQDLLRNLQGASQ